MLGGLLGDSGGGSSGPIAIATTHSQSSSNGSTSSAGSSNSTTSSTAVYSALRTADYDEEAEMKPKTTDQLFRDKYVRKQMKKHKFANQRIDANDSGSSNSNGSGSSDEDGLYSSGMKQAKRQQDQNLLSLGESIKRLSNMSWKISNELDLTQREIQELEIQRDTIQDESNFLSRTSRWLTRQESPAIQFCLAIFIVVCLVIAAVKVYFFFKE